MKVFLVLFIAFFTVEGVAQRGSAKQLQKLDKFNMDGGTIDLSDQNAVSDLEEFLAFDKQYKRKKRSGFIFAGAGAILATTGV